MRVRTQCNDARQESSTASTIGPDCTRLCLVFHSDGWNGVYPNMTGIGLITFLQGQFECVETILSQHTLDAAS